MILFKYCVAMARESLRYILAQNIKRRRKQLQLTQSSLASHAKISETHINEIERCITWVREETLEKIADALHVEPYELFIPFDDEEQKNEKSEKVENAYNVMNSKKQELYEQIKSTVDYAIRQVTAIYEANENPEDEN